MKNRNKLEIMVCISLIILTSCGNASKNNDKSDVNNNSKGVKVGNQTWMTENLNVGQFQNGDSIPEAKTSEEWEEANVNDKPVWCYLGYNSENGKKYGKLYNWYAVNDPRGLAPKGWHIPSAAEWKELIDFLGGEDHAAIKLKSTSGWVKRISNGGGGSYGANDPESGKSTNESGFGAMPGGCNKSGKCFFDGSEGWWWSKTSEGSKATSVQMNAEQNTVNLMSEYQIYGLSLWFIGSLYKRLI